MHNYLSSLAFEASELYHWTDLKKVIEVLSALSKTDDAKRLGVGEFPAVNTGPNPVYDDPCNDESDQLYSTLPGLLDGEDSSSRESMGSTDFDGMMSQVPGMYKGRIQECAP